MASYDWQQLIQQAEEAGLEYELQPPGEYHVEVVKANVAKSQGGKDKLGVQLKILDGPRAGKSFWDNITVSPENPKAMAIFFRTVSNYGGDVNVLRSGGTLEALGAQFVGKRGTVNLQHRQWNGKALHDVKSFRPDVAGAAPPVVAPPVQQVPVPAAPPVPVAPVQAAPVEQVPVQAAPQPAPAPVATSPAVPF